MLAALMAPAAFGETGVRQKLPLGIQLALADPFPGLFGLKVAYQLSPWMRGHLGAARASGAQASLTTFACGVRFLHPRWQVSPVAGVSVAGVTHGGTGSVSGFASSGINLYPTVGVDWQTEEGFSLGVHYHYGVIGAKRGSPSVSLGWFFSP